MREGDISLKSVEIAGSRLKPIVTSIRSVPTGRVSVVETLIPLVLEQAAIATRRMQRTSFSLMLTGCGGPRNITRFTLMPPSLTWQCTAFAELSPADLYAAMELRQRVFVVEQNCAYLDADGTDKRSLHLLGWNGEAKYPRLVAYARLLPPKTKYAEASIGRVCTHPDIRGSGAGKILMHEAIRVVEESWGPEIRIAAQMYLERFYETFGFRRVTDPYLEDDIWHVDMRRG
jgi:ElaA protein